ncbi:MAG: hypothetical protein AMJ65_13665 [Phycisphaerae bacterium SG8_4]|nr:MAG: hypothetical protein AMJ65_13665 [Phycisphaerae bacterium SG8_4]
MFCRLNIEINKRHKQFQIREDYTAQRVCQQRFVASFGEYLAFFWPIVTDFDIGGRSRKIMQKKLPGSWKYFDSCYIITPTSAVPVYVQPRPWAARLS